MTLQQLEYIVALDDHRHFVKAAEHCFVSQPNLTMQVKKLEDEIGVKIFDRSKKPIQPTPIGIEILQRARRILRESKQLSAFVNHEKETLEGEFSIGIIPTVAPYLLPAFLPRFIEENPRLHLKISELQTGQIISRLRQGTIDIGVLATPLNEENIIEHTLYYEPFLLYLPDDHRLVNKAFLLADDLETRDLLVLNEGHCFREQTLSICGRSQKGDGIGFDYQSGSIEALKNLVKKGVGYTLVPELSVQGEEQSKGPNVDADFHPGWPIVTPARRQIVTGQGSCDDHEALKPHTDVYKDRHEEGHKDAAAQLLAPEELRRKYVT